MLRKCSLDILATSLFLSAGLVGCAGGAFTKIEKTDLPKELSADVKEKFEVRDLSQSQAQTQAQAQAKATLVSQDTQPKPKATQKKKKKEKQPAAGAPSPASVEPFVFPSRRPAKDPIWVGEKLTYQVTYLGIP